MRWLAIILLMACTSPVEPKDALTWYRELEECSGLHGDFYAINWIVTDDIPTGYYGWWNPPHTIRLRPSADEHKTKHEMMHDLLGRGDHPPRYFDGVCGDLLP
jgi:hypothetical protein